MNLDSRPRILCVDDEQNILDGLTRTLRSLYSVETSLGGAQGLETLKSKGPFSVIVSDFRMPNMSGAEFLSAARQIAPDSVRILLTGQAGLNEAIAAVNDGNIFRFMTKPCPTEVLVKSLAACVEQYRLVTSERVLLEQTLRESVKALTGILAMSSPEAFGRATRVQRMVSELMDHFGIHDRWGVEVACMVSQIGCVTLPPKTQEKLYTGELLTDDELAMTDRASKVAEQLLADIPRLELVREILHFHRRRFAEEKIAEDGVTGEAIPWGARALKIAIDFDFLGSDKEASNSLNALCGREGWYDPAMLDAFVKLHGGREKEVAFCDLPLREITAGMIFGEDVRSVKGLLLIARGQEATEGMLERAHNFYFTIGIREPIRMVVRQAAPSSAPQVLVAK
jgi:response regulator RpfG family c-di-GMP phosphodiesterase